MGTKRSPELGSAGSGGVTDDFDGLLRGVADDLLTVYIAHDGRGAEIPNVVGAALLIQINVPVKQQRRAVIDIADLLMRIAQGVGVDVVPDVRAAVFHAALGKDERFFREALCKKA